MYNDFAYIYDSMMDIDYYEWFSYIEDIFKLYGIKPKSIVDLACGTGNMTLLFAEKGYNVTGIDLSSDMLNVAQEKARKKGLSSVPFICQNIIDFEIHKKNDIALINCDGLNYILLDNDLKKVFKNVFLNLNEDGLFIFDISSKYKLSKILGNNTFVEENNNVFMIWENKFNVIENIVEMDLTFFIKSNNMYNRFDEYHKQKAHQIEDIIKMLKEVGFRNISHFKHLTFDKPNYDNERYMVVAQK